MRKRKNKVSTLLFGLLIKWYSIILELLLQQISLVRQERGILFLNICAISFLQITH